jgi:pimeloyl-ACP methyl ester carboxylesterase
MNWDFIYRGETRDLDDVARASAEGSFINLPSGCTHYELIGPETSRPIVLVHGFSVPYFVWDTTFPALTSTGHRVLRYDLLGRGFSDRPHVRYNLATFVRQLSDLLDALQFQAVDLVGLSMGGAIATTFTGQYPDRVRRLVLIDPVGTEPMPFSLFYKAALIPIISELLLSLVGTEKMVQNLAGDFFDPSEIAYFLDQYRIQMQFHGFKRAIISTLRNKGVDGAADAYARLGQLNTPVLLFWGRQDQTLPLAQSESILNVVPRAQFHIVENAGHIPNYEQPNIVHPILLQFLDTE